MLPSSAHGKLVHNVFYIACSDAFVRTASKTDLISLWCLLFNFRNQRHQATLYLYDRAEEILRIKYVIGVLIH